MTFTPATIVLVLLILGWAVWAVRRLTGRGLCDCHDHCAGCAKGAKRGPEAKAGACACCAAADKMVAAMEEAAAKDAVASPTERPGERDQ